MIANYHTHTPRCMHAQGTEEAYVQAALAARLRTLGFSDHTPYLFPDGYVSTFRMTPDQLADYAATVLRLRQAYARQIEIPLGVEAEFYPKYFGDTVSFLRDHGIEYMILAQHMLFNEVEGIGAAGPTADHETLRQYCDQTIEAMYTGLFSYFAHPDLLCFVGDGRIYREEIGRLCRTANDCGMPLEINLLGLREGKHYPNPRFWEIAAEENCTVILGADAHQPEALLNTQAEQTALEMVNDLGLHLIDTTPLRRI